jgi:hypothetical protein
LNLVLLIGWLNIIFESSSLFATSPSVCHIIVFETTLNVRDEKPKEFVYSRIIYIYKHENQNLTNLHNLIFVC